MIQQLFFPFVTVTWLQVTTGFGPYLRCNLYCCLCVSNTPHRKPLPKLVYNLLADKELRKKLNDAGLPTHGHRKVFDIRYWLAVHVVKPNESAADNWMNVSSGTGPPG